MFFVNISFSVVKISYYYKSTCPVYIKMLSKSKNYFCTKYILFFKVKLLRQFLRAYVKFHYYFKLNLMSNVICNPLYCSAIMAADVPRITIFRTC